MKRINHLVSLIDKCNNVIDVGCDHCYLAIKLLQNNQAQYVLNIDINEKPLLNGIHNLDKYNLLSFTDNVVNDGLKAIEKKVKIKPYYDYLTIAGMGAKNIISILKNNKLKIKYYILQANNNLFELRKYLSKSHYKIIKEDIVKENNIYYPIIVAKKNLFHKLYSKLDLYFGKLNNVVNPNLSYEYLNDYLHYLLKHDHVKKNQELIKLTEKIIKKYESKWNL